MKDQREAGQKQGNRARRPIALLTIAALGMVAGGFFGKVYLVQELLVVVALTALVVFFAANLVVLGILFHAIGKSILHSIRNAGQTLAQKKANAEQPAHVFRELSRAGAEASPDSR